MEETDVPIPSVAPPRDHSNDIPQNGGLLPLPSSLMSPVTDDINMLLDSVIGQQRATLAVDPNVETRSNPSSPTAIIPASEEAKGNQGGPPLNRILTFHSTFGRVTSWYQPLPHLIGWANMTSNIQELPRNCRH